MTGSAVGPARLAAAHPQQAAARGAGQALQGPGRPVQDRDRARHVADRLRRAVPAHDVRRQADARPRADAGHRPREPRLQGQAGRPGRRLPRPRRRAEAGAGDYTESGGTGQDGASIRPRPSRVMLEKYEICCGLLPRLRLVATGRRARRTSGWRCCRRRRSTSWRRRTARTGLLQAVTELSQAVRARGAARRGAGDPRRRGVLPGRARGAREARAGRAQDRRGARPRHPADRLARPSRPTR